MLPGHSICDAEKAVEAAFGRPLVFDSTFTGLAVESVDPCSADCLYATALNRFVGQFPGEAHNPLGIWYFIGERVGTG